MLPSTSWLHPSAQTSSTICKLWLTLILKCVNGIIHNAVRGESCSLRQQTQQGSNLQSYRGIVLLEGTTDITFFQFGEQKNTAQRQDPFTIQHRVLNFTVRLLPPVCFLQHTSQESNHTGMFLWQLPGHFKIILLFIIPEDCLHDCLKI